MFESAGTVVQNGEWSAYSGYIRLWRLKETYEARKLFNSFSFVLICNELKITSVLFIWDKKFGRRVEI